MLSMALVFQSPLKAAGMAEGKPQRPPILTLTRMEMVNSVTFRKGACEFCRNDSPPERRPNLATAQFSGSLTTREFQPLSPN